MSYSTTTFTTTIEDRDDYEFDVDVEVSYWMARRPVSEDDGDEIDLVSIKACHQVEDGDTQKIIHLKGDEIECDEIMKYKIRQDFYQYLIDEREDAMERKWESYFERDMDNA